MRTRASVGAAIVLGAIAVLGPAGSVIARPGAGTVVLVRGAKGALALSRHTVNAGRITFRVSANAGRSGPLMFTLARGVSVQRVFADAREQSSNVPSVAAKGTRELTRDATFYGLADVAQHAPLGVTERLGTGTYYLVDLEARAGSPPAVATLRVLARANERQQAPHRNLPTVLMNRADRFISPSVLPARGDIRVRNTSDTLHFLSLLRVKPGTTERKVQAFFDGSSKSSPLLKGPGAELNVLSPGKQARMTWKLPAGTYVMVCFIADDKTGMPHAAMGMHKVVVLR